MTRQGTPVADTHPMPDPRDTLDVSSLAPGGRESAPPPGQRPFLRILFRCATGESSYTRCYRNADGQGYTARCPRCGRVVRFRVGREGSDSRAFEVHCAR
jgi:hypothetical protein